MNFDSSVRIKSNEVHLWIAMDDQCNRSELLKQYHQLLNQSEKEQHQRFHFERHRNQYLITRALLRSTLSLYVPTVFPQDWCFYRNQYGKPYIQTDFIAEPLNFNLSHTQNMVVLAVTRHCEIGVDVEYTQRENNTIDIAESYFSSEETRALFQLDESLQHNRFFDLWTLKEAYIKACSMGLSIPLNAFSYHFPSEGKVAISFAAERNDHPDNWQFGQFDLPSSHKIAVAIQHQSKLKSNLSLSVKSIVPLETTSAQIPVNSLNNLKTSV